MATGRDVVYGALSYDLDRQSEASIEDDELKDGIKVLNQWLSSLEADGVNLGFTWLDNASETVTVPTGALLGIEQNLAIQIVPMFQGTVSPQLQTNARNSMQVLLNLGVQVPTLSYPKTLPRGSGQRGYNPPGFNTFFDGKSVPACNIRQESNTTETVISTVDTPVLVLGTWTEVGAIKFTTTAAGRMTYTGEETKNFTIQSRFTTTVTDKHVNYYVYLNGVKVEPSKTGSYVATTAVIPLYFGIVLRKNDYIEIYVENIDDTTNILVADATVEAG